MTFRVTKSSVGFLGVILSMTWGESLWRQFEGARDLISMSHSVEGVFLPGDKGHDRIQYRTDSGIVRTSYEEPLGAVGISPDPALPLVIFYDPLDMNRQTTERIRIQSLILLSVAVSAAVLSLFIIVNSLKTLRKGSP